MRSPSFLGLEIWLKPSESVPDREREREKKRKRERVARICINFEGNILLENSLISCQMLPRSKFRSIVFIIYN